MWSEEADRISTTYLDLQLFAPVTLTLVSFHVNPRTVIPRWQRAALDLADLNLMKEGSDLKKERAGRKSSFSSGLLTSGDLSPAVVEGREIYVGRCDDPLQIFLGLPRRRNLIVPIGKIWIRQGIWFHADPPDFPWRFSICVKLLHVSRCRKRECANLLLPRT